MSNGTMLNVSKELQRLRARQLVVTTEDGEPRASDTLFD